MEKVACVVIDFMGVASMFRRYGCEIVGPADIERSDIVVFTGGEDINPALYGEKPGDRTYFSPRRDSAEIASYERAVELEKPIAGICRGAQLVNVLNGGRLLQHVNGHTTDHTVEDIYGNFYWASSIHHQMMIRHPSSCLIAWANEGHEKYSYQSGHYEKYESNIDPEVVFYPRTKAVLIQGHPEIQSFRYQEMTDLFFWYLSELLSFKVK